MPLRLSPLLRRHGPTSTRFGPARGWVVLALWLLTLPSAFAFGQDGQPALPVTVAKPVERTITETTQVTGRFEASEEVALTARVSGYLESSHFREGQSVAAGDLLFRIDDEPFRTALAQAEAELRVQKTRVDLAQQNLDRSSRLIDSGTISSATLEANQQAFLESQAALDAANAALQSARLDLEYAEIEAPISGKIGRKLISEGNLVVAGTQGQGTVLTTILSTDPIHFFFDVDESTYLSFRRRVPREQDDGLPVEIALPDEAAFSRSGTIDYVDTRVDERTGSVNIRATVANGDGFLVPGLFGRARMAIGMPYKALVVPDTAIGVSADGHFVMLVDAEGTVTPRPVEAGPRFGDFRAVLSGLHQDDLVIINGLMRAQPGATVAPQQTSLEVPDNPAANAVLR